MAKPWIVGFGVIALGGLFACFHDDTKGLVVASLCLIVGLVVIVSSEAHGLVSNPRGAGAQAGGGKQAQILVLVKGDVHPYPHCDGRLQEAPHPATRDVAFEVFMQCWLVLGSELSLGINDLQLTLQGSDGSTRTGERTVGDLNNWLLAEAEKVSETGSDWKRGTARTTPLKLSEFDTVAPLKCGEAREGWLHFHIRNTTPLELQTGSLELSIKDSSSHVHTAAPIRVQRLLGSVRPVLDRNPPQPVGDLE